MIYIGNHTSITNGYAAMGLHEQDLGGDTLAFFTRNPRGGKSKEIDPSDLDAFRAFLKEHHFGPLVAHAAYTMNRCAAKESTRQNGLEMLHDDLEKLNGLPEAYYNFHPGSHVGQGPDVGIALIADALNRMMPVNDKTIVLLETMAGKGSEIGRNFEELRAIIDLVESKDRIGVCFDTCHVWDAGYDIASNLDGVLKQFDDIIGLDRLYAVHLNDSVNDCGAHKDRHARLGEGRIGPDALQRVVTHPLLADKPFILETPNDDEGYTREIALVHSWIS